MSIKNKFIYLSALAMIATASLIAFAPSAANAYGEGGGGIVAPWFLITTPAPTPAPTQTPNPNAVSESGQYYKVGSNVYENASGHRVGLSEFQQLGLNFSLLPTKTVSVNQPVVAVRNNKPAVAVNKPVATSNPTASVQPSNSPEQLPLQAAIGQTVQSNKTNQPNVFSKMFKWLFRRK